MNRKCFKCKKTKNISCYTTNSQRKDGYNCYCKPCQNKYNREYHNKNKDKINIRKRELHIIKEYIVKKREYRNKNRDRIKSYVNAYVKRRKKDIHYKLKQNLRSRICGVLKGKIKSGQTMDILGCSVEQFKKYLESQFRDGMNWTNYGRKGWHMDHIKPCFSFDLTDAKQQRQCFHYTNIRPLWWYENYGRTLEDYNKYIK